MKFLPRLKSRNDQAGFYVRDNILPAELGTNLAD